MVRGAPQVYTQEQVDALTAYIDKKIGENEHWLEFEFEERELSTSVPGPFTLTRACITHLIKLYQGAKPKWKKVSWREEYHSYGEDYNSSSHFVPAALVLEREL